MMDDKRRSPQAARGLETAIDADPGDPLAMKLSYLGYALTYSLLEELEQQRPGTWKRVWSKATEMLRSHHLHDSADDEWIRATIERHGGRSRN